jgi:hypothetical protein
MSAFVVIAAAWEADRKRRGALPGIMHHPDALSQHDPRPWPALRAGITRNQKKF